MKPKDECPEGYEEGLPDFSPDQLPDQEPEPVALANSGLVKEDDEAWEDEAWEEVMIARVLARLKKTYREYFSEINVEQMYYPLKIIIRRVDVESEEMDRTTWEEGG